MVLDTGFGTYENCYLKLDRYVVDNTPAIEIRNDTDGPIARLTVCLGAKGLTEEYGDNFAFVDTNNLPSALDFVREYKLGTVTNKTALSGFCRYPLVEFDMQELMKYTG